jgi:hypothetical protein
VAVPFDGFDRVSAVITARLAEAGWERTKRSKESEVPEFVFNNGMMRIAVFQEVDDPSVSLTLTDILEDSYLRLEVRYGSDPSELLCVLVEWQDSVSGRNFHEMVNSVARACPDTFAEPFEGDENAPWERVIPRTE